MKEILLYILENILILEGGEKIHVEEEDVDGVVTLKAHVPKSKMGLVIGKGGKTINAIKNILKVKAIKENKRIEVEVIEG